jgi:predicted lipoprotein with Yx(FWY)xxD motif
VTGWATGGGRTGLAAARASGSRAARRDRGTITRSDGTTQAVYNGHPLYSYIADTAPGQAHGNNLNLNGGLWHEVMVSG